MNNFSRGGVLAGRKASSFVASRIVPPVPPGWVSWEELMAEALDEAKQAGRAGDVPVGAVLVSGSGSLLARAGNAVERLHDPTAHAEILALRKATDAIGNYRLEGAVLAVTLEPCLMCTGALAHARLAGVVYGAPDARAGAVSSCLEGLDLHFLNHKVWHMGRILEQQCACLLRDFFALRR